MNLYSPVWKSMRLLWFQRFLAFFNHLPNYGAWFYWDTHHCVETNYFSAILFVAYWCSKPYKTRTVSGALCIMGWEWRHPPVSLWNALFYIRVHTGLDDSCGKLICLIYLTRSSMFLRVISYQPMQNTFYWCIFRAEFIEASQDAWRFLSQKHEVPESEKLSRN